MKHFLFAVLIGLLALTSCQQDDINTEPIAELPFATHPSVLRGDWSGTIFNTPESKNATLELSDLSAECANLPEDEIAEGKCARYVFSGTVSLNGSQKVPVRGEGYGNSYIYTLTSPLRTAPPMINGSFELDGERWDFYADYLDDSPDLDGDAIFEGRIFLTDSTALGASFLLEPANP